MKHKHHIIPKHMGGTDDLCNLIELTPLEHADAHKKLYEEHGRWQDYVAWQGLAKLTEKQDLVRLMLSESGKKGVRSRPNNTGMKYDTSNIKKNGTRAGEKNPAAKEFLITHPDGKQENVKSLKTWCELKGLNYGTFYNMCVGRKVKHKDYSAIKI